LSWSFLHGATKAAEIELRRQRSQLVYENRKLLPKYVIDGSTMTCCEPIAQHTTIGENNPAGWLCGIISFTYKGPLWQTIGLT
jgi:hypothetical protein